MYGKEVENAVQEAGAEKSEINVTGAGTEIVEVFEKIKKLSVELKKVEAEIESVEKRITELKTQLRELEDKKHTLVLQRREYNMALRSNIERIQSEIGIPIFGIMQKAERRTEKTEKTGTKKFGFKVKIKTTEDGVRMGLQQVDNIFESVKEAYYSLYPERRGRSYKFRELIEKLAEKGLIELTYL